MNLPNSVEPVQYSAPSTWNRLSASLLYRLLVIGRPSCNYILPTPSNDRMLTPRNRLLACFTAVI
ncbi:hypothetical protein HYDPIDRAFT_116242 [Hydnomerulius pinastri MD-312]|uniref:Uncharacterized protein n=1 Tax=Hydnomerulius pinastri MD-312 TaxID=994086 RepID=A0A0C9WBJ5_9AGAM|nr:hypothetical protein HYDPIDRAFT_116242 [Hydnomerulius pinastri MD-312]